MFFAKFKALMVSVSGQIWRSVVCGFLVGAIVLLGCLPNQPALAALEDDHYDGNIFALYGGNGSLVPPKVTLADSLQRDKATLMVFYVDDSRDCKLYAPVVSRLQGFYGRATDFLMIRADAIPPQSTYTPAEPGYYYKGLVPQTVVLDPTGKVALNTQGILSFEQLDDAFRKVFDLLPRSQSNELKRRPLNDVNTEFSP
jgi:hypothetical protein